MITAHLHSFLSDRKIPFVALPFGVQIEAKFYDHDIFRNFNLCFIDTTFIINYKN